MSAAATDLPPGIVQNISSYLSWTDVLAVRATARHWASALAPVVTRLRVPLVNPTSLHKRPAAAGADEEADADAGAAKHPFSTAGQAADASAGALKAQPHPVEQLSAVLERLPNVDSITLVLSTATSGPDLEGALQVIGRKERVSTVTIYEVGHPPAESAVDRQRAYVSGLKLHYLQSVRVLKLKTLSWALAEIWEQVGELHSCHCSSSGGAAPTHVADVAGSSGSSSGTEGPAGSSGRGYALHTLVIEQLPSLPVRVCCTLRDKQLPTQLKHLTTPLPGQYSRSHEVVGPLNTQHQQYLEQLAAALPQLESLTVTDEYQGSEHVFTQHFSRLKELKVVFGGSFRSHPFEFLVPDQETITFELASRMANLQQMCLLPQRMLPTKGLQQPVLSTRHMLGVLGRESGVEISPYRLDWLQFNTQLQHLAAPLLQSGEDVSAYNGQLRSLVAECDLPATELLQQVAAVGSALTSLTLYHYDTQAAPGSVDGQAVPGFVDGVAFMTPLLSAGRAISALTNLHSLTLMGRNRTQYELTDPDSVWSQLPALRSLKLQNVSLRSAARTSLPVELGGTVTLLGSDDSPGSRRVLWLSYLPCQQLTHLELSRYHIVLQPDPAVSEAAGAQGRGSSSSHSAGGSHATDLSGLKHLALTDCGCLLLQPQAARTQQDLPALLQRCAVTPPSSEAVPTGLQPLLSKLIAPDSRISNVRTLQLNYLNLDLLDVHDIMCSPIGLQLQQLHIENCDILSSNDSQPPGEDMLALVVEAAAAAGHLQELRSFELLLRQEGKWSMTGTASSQRGSGVVVHRHLLPSLNILASCCKLSKLQQLYLQLLLTPDAVAAETPACSCTSTPRDVLGPGGVWEQLPKLQHLQELVLVLKHGDAGRDMGPEGQAAGHKDVVGHCSDCGRAVSCSQLEQWLHTVGPGLSGCNIDVELR